MAIETEINRFDRLRAGRSPQRRFKLNPRAGKIAGMGKGDPQHAVGERDRRWISDGPGNGDGPFR
jgi:hypothetical protein